MPIDYSIENECVITIGKGEVTFQEVNEMLLRQKTDPSIHNDFDELLDITEIEELQLSENELKILAINSPFGSNSRRAIIVSSDLAFGQARMYEMLQESTGAEVSVFRIHSDAISWLNENKPDRKTMQTNELWPQ